MNRAPRRRLACLSTRATIVELAPGKATALASVAEIETPAGATRVSEDVEDARAETAGAPELPEAAAAFAPAVT